MSAVKANWSGLVRGTIIKTGELSYCLIGEWETVEAIVAAPPSMIDTLNTFRSLLDDQCEGKDILDALFGEVALKFA